MIYRSFSFHEVKRNILYLLTLETFLSRFDFKWIVSPLRAHATYLMWFHSLLVLRK